VVAKPTLFFQVPDSTYSINSELWASPENVIHGRRFNPINGSEVCMVNGLNELTFVYLSGGESEGHPGPAIVVCDRPD
jgi:hypothetical protein